MFRSNRTKADTRPTGPFRSSLRVMSSVAAAALCCIGATGLAGAVGPASVAGASGQSATTVPAETLTVPTAHHHRYRHGAVPRKTRNLKGVAALGTAASTQAPSASGRLLQYGGGLTAGGLSGAGVTTGQPEVYLVFMGSQWGTESTNGSGQHVFSGDASSMAPAIQTFFAGLGTNNESWSGVFTQYCDGAALGATSCIQGSTLIPHPSGGVLSGVWYDNSTTATDQETAGLTGHQLASEAEVAATHFGRTDQASNRNTQYVIVSPTGTNPDGWANTMTGYCAYHDDTHDPYLGGGGPVAGPIAAFTNLPYVPDAGAYCGAGTVSSPGTLDGATEAASHEYAETLTDQFPETYPYAGWTKSTGDENGDLCAYVSSGPGAAFALALSTGTVAVQGTWSNRANNGKGSCMSGESDYVFAPVITSVSARSGAAGSTVTIDGVNLLGAASVAFGGSPATIVSDTVTSITAVVPTNGVNGSITVTTSVGTATSIRAFNLVPTVTSIAPISVLHGSSVTISGSGLGVAKKVTIGGKKAVVTSNTSTQIVVVVPVKAATGPVSVGVVTKYGTAASATPLIIG